MVGRELCVGPDRAAGVKTSAVRELVEAGKSLGAPPNDSSRTADSRSAVIAQARSSPLVSATAAA